MKYLVATILLVFSFASGVMAAGETTIKNAGLVPANIWYSKDPFYAGDKVRIYTVIFNGSTYDLAGSMEFLDNGTSLGSANFTVAGGGNVREVWIDWQATEGAHTITARVKNAYRIAGGSKTAIVLENTDTGKNERSVELSPEAKVAQAAADAQKNEATRQELVAKAEQAKDAVSNVTLPVRAGTSAGVGALDRFRAATGLEFQALKKEKAQELQAIKAHEEASKAATSTPNVQSATDRMLNVAEKPFAYVLYGIFAALQYVFEWRIVFYGVILYALYRVLKWAIRKVRER